MKSKKDLGVCVICGKNPAVTKDHIPPKGIFIKPRPNNLIRVPACTSCNNASSGLDERFRAYLGLHVSRSKDMFALLFSNEASKTLDHNLKLYREILTKMEPVYLTTPAGIIYDKGCRVPWDSEAHDAIVERTVRGLYYHHFNEILGDRVNIKIYWFRELTSEIVEMLTNLKLNSFGKGEVIYRYGRAVDSPLSSLWIFQFYKSHWAGGITTTKSL